MRGESTASQRQAGEQKTGTVYLSSAHSFSFLICASSSGVKSFWMLNSCEENDAGGKQAEEDNRSVRVGRVLAFSHVCSVGER